ncbi:hypothetical protein [Yoonia sp. I 8.24]|uniref:capsular polysaccharide export protein, LipB/KpsS family n=1 Tax=Yoonia sp. I 8.24 TaxID=1537229 RepID=UPI001EE14F06|nr:hypothetical protein [Yoonia sp. I 8.24]MCG3267679.1 hypothetical protein [Yoonia sp. I 8.24]
MFHPLDTRAPQVLLLQGPVGPFFQELHSGLVSRGFAVKRVVFNAGDKIFTRGDYTYFRGAKKEWANWLRAEMVQNRPSFIVVFGAMRPMHFTARQVASLYGVPVICLEEGYLRSGYITCELGGNNDSSPLCRWTPDQIDPATLPEPLDMPSPQSALRIWAAIYYLMRDLKAAPAESALFHRKREGIGRLATSWGKHLTSRACVKHEILTKLKKLQTRLKGKYILVTLQVPEDSQIRYSSRGWTNQKLVKQTLLALRESTTEQTVVFKLHPLDRNAGQTRRLIAKYARALGLSRRVMTLGTGAIGEVTRHASGMIVINSTSAFSALHHGVPILVLGDAIYRHDALVTTGTKPSAIANFMQSRAAKPKANFDAFRRSVRARALLPGDFYREAGRKVAVDAIAQKLEQELSQISLPVGPN